MSALNIGDGARLKKRHFARITLLATTISLIIGCAANGNVPPTTVAETPPQGGETSVMHLEDGRDGFIISEIPQMDESSRRDFERAVALLNDKGYLEAIELLERVIEQSPGVTAPYINIAIAYQQVGKPEQAEKHLKTALMLVPGHPVASNEYGLLFRKSGRFSEARAMYEESLTSFPDYYPVHRNLGILCDLYLNDLTCAIEHYEMYSQAMPEDRQVKIWISDLRARMGSQ